MITKSKRTMGIREMVLERAKKEGLEKGKETKSYEVVKNLIERMNLTDAQAADMPAYRWIL